MRRESELKTLVGLEEDSCRLSLEGDAQTDTVDCDQVELQRKSE